MDLAMTLDKSSIFKKQRINLELKGDKNQTLKIDDQTRLVVSTTQKKKRTKKTFEGGTERFCSLKTNGGLRKGRDKNYLRALRPTCAFS